MKDRQIFKAKKRKIFKAKNNVARRVFKKVESDVRKVFKTRNWYDDVERWFACRKVGNRTTGRVCVHRLQNWNKYFGWKKCRNCTRAEKFEQRIKVMKITRRKE